MKSVKNFWFMKPPATPFCQQKCSCFSCLIHANLILSWIIVVHVQNFHLCSVRRLICNLAVVRQNKLLLETFPDFQNTLEKSLSQLLWRVPHFKLAGLSIASLLPNIYSTKNNPTKVLSPSQLLWCSHAGFLTVTPVSRVRLYPIFKCLLTAHFYTTIFAHLQLPLCLFMQVGQIQIHSYSYCLLHKIHSHYTQKICSNSHTIK